MERPAWAPQGIDLTVPSASRMYDYYLGGSHNFEVDREAGRKAVDALPATPKIAQANRAFMHRAIRFAAAEGITRFLDIGSGIPTFGNVHETARRLDHRAQVVYVDNDPVAIAHSRAVLADGGGADIVAADFRSPQDILLSPQVEQLLAPGEPVALMLVALLHFIEDKDAPARSVARLRDALPDGSLLILSHAAVAGGPAGEDVFGVQKIYRDARTPLVPRRPARLREFFEGFELVDPGLVPLVDWHPDGPGEPQDIVRRAGWAGVGRKAVHAG